MDTSMDKNMTAFSMHITLFTAKILCLYHITDNFEKNKKKITHAPSERSVGQQMDFFFLSFFSSSTPPTFSAATN